MISNEELVGKVIEDVYGHEHKLVRYIGGGAQGRVFLTADPTIAVKLLFDDKGDLLTNENANEEVQSERKKLNKLRLLPIPKWLNITMPKAMLKDYVGYVMNFLEDMGSFYDVINFNKYEPLKSDYLSKLDKKRSVSFGKSAAFGGTRRIFEMYLRFAALLSGIHSVGLVFCDVSDNNVFVSNVNDCLNVWLIDADNLNYEEITIGADTTVFTPGYGAPEVCDSNLGESTEYSDSWAFAVSLFRNLFEQHPFYGEEYNRIWECKGPEDAEAMASSGNLPWIMDRDDYSNQSDVSIAEVLVSDSLLDMFDRTFSSSGIENPVNRTVMPEWAHALAKDCDITIQCPCCKMYGIYKNKCSWCDSKPKVLKLDSYYMKDGKKTGLFWQYVHETTDKKKFDVPLRVINNFRCREVNEKAFSVEKNGDKLIFSDFLRKYSIYLSKNGSEYLPIVGKCEINGDFFIKFIPKDIHSKLGVLIEGGVEN